MGEIWTPSNTSFLEQLDPPPQTAFRSSQPFIQNSRSLPTDGQTDRPTEYRTRNSVSTDQQTDRPTDILIAILRTLTGGAK